MSSQLVKRDFFGPDAKHARNLKLTTIERPLLYNIIHGIISRADKEDGDTNEVCNGPDDLGGNNTDDMNKTCDASDDLRGNNDPVITGTCGTELADGVDEMEPEVSLNSCSGSLEDVMADYG
ncbi:hypothetical protein PGTUg99_002595 [Puccinia graminis f. sp. tritici]|uniref:Uncharacterized protein n=1 Tax=Puccinia graminis f. sp. tritici TaxID=56615 RepID=A0A5B0M189_PUCGR|nr:hypothetical protein PGTUg99_002595 [Puccinia graminis f. sp. tritici]